MRKIWVWFFYLGLTVSIVVAQITCPQIVEHALITAAEACDTPERNQACYGNHNIDTELFADFDGSFAYPGDVAPLSALDVLRLSPLDEARGYWGIAFLSVQANLPDTLPGQNVSILLFGDVEIDNAVSSVAVEATATVTSDSNVRSGPSTNFTVLGSLSVGDRVQLNGRNEAADWLRFRRDNGTVGWIFASLVTVEGDIEALPIMDSGAMSDTIFTPMQAFYFQTGIGTAKCDEVPQSGILIQSPEGTVVELVINDVEVTLRSTIFIQANPSAEMVVHVLDGTIDATFDHVTAIVPTGTRIHIPINTANRATGKPSNPEPFNLDDLRNLPLQLLPHTIALPEPLPLDEIEGVVNAILAERTVEIPSVPANPEVTSSPTTPFGHWVGIDTDGSSMTLDITDLGSGRISAYLYDFGATGCGPTLPPAEASGEGRVDAAGNLQINMSARCLNPPSPLDDFLFTTVFNTANNTMTDQWGVVWRR